MATVVTIMDRPTFRTRTDVIVVADRENRTLTWVPRDLWVEAISDRVNEAYALGGHDALASALAAHGIEVDAGLCLSREATEAGLEGVEVAMPIERTMSYWYPLSPQEPIQEGRKLIRFQAPVERLSGERIHQWLGARHGVEEHDFGDLRRIRRQQQLLTVMLADDFDFGRFLETGHPVESTGERALAELREVAADWEMVTWGPTRNEVIDGKIVLLPA